MISVSLALVVILGSFMIRPPIIFIGLASLVALAATLYMHLGMYEIDYRNFTFNTSIQQHATQITIFALVVLGLGYALSLPRGTPVKNLLGEGSSAKPTTNPRYGPQGPSQSQGPNPLYNYWFGNDGQKPPPQQQQRRQMDPRQNENEYFQRALERGYY